MMDYSYNWITTRIVLGGQFESEADADELVKAGITDIINCREVADPDYVQAKFSNHWPQPRQLDDGSSRTRDWFIQGAAAYSAVVYNPGRKFYVHCHAGLNRSASMVYFLLRTLGLYPDDAKHLIEKHRWFTLVGIRYADEAEMYVGNSVTKGE